jgi:hypothetical protein
MIICSAQVMALGALTSFTGASGGMLPDPGTLIDLIASLAAPMTPDTVIGDITKASFVGYTSSQALGGWSAPYLDQNGNPTMEATPVSWTPSGSTGSQNVIGYYVHNTSSGFIYGEMFDTPIPMTGILSLCTVIPRFSLPREGDYGSGIVSA